LTIDLVVEGNYQGLCRFFEGVAGMQRAVALKRLDLQVREAATQFPINLTMVLYFGVPEKVRTKEVARGTG
jgi:Tfp pilus assembly protein PilO